MPATYDKIATYTLPSATSTYTFTSIPSTYTDLVLIGAGKATNDIDINFKVNGSTSGYSRTMLAGNGTSTFSARATSQAFGRLNYGAFWQSTSQGNFQVHFLNYANTNVYKTILNRTNNAGSGVDALVNLWANTAAISSIEIYTAAFNFDTGSTFTLYGIKAA